MNRIRKPLSFFIAALMLFNMWFLAPPTVFAATYGPDDRLTDPAVSYDENGNLLDDGTTAYIYDTANRLVQTAVGADTNAYTYDGLGNLVEISENGTATELVLNENTAYPTILGEIQGATTRSYAYGMGVHAQKTGGAVAYPLVDHQGTIRHMTDAAGAVTHSRYYNAWGETRHTTGGSGPTLGYTGEREMADGTVYLRARAYQPRMGKMVQRDGIDPAFYGRGSQSHNRYSYVENNPVNYTDPSGHLVFTEDDTTVDPGMHPGGGVSTAPSRGGRGTVGVAPMGRGMGSPGVPNYAPRPAVAPTMPRIPSAPPLKLTPDRKRTPNVGPTMPAPNRINPPGSPLPGLSDDPTEDWLRDLSKKYGNGGRFCASANDNRHFKSRKAAKQGAKDRAGVEKRSKMVDQFTRGNDPNRRGHTDYDYSEDLGSHGRYEVYETPNGLRVIAEHTNDPNAPSPHFHAGGPSQRTADPKYFRDNRYRPVPAKPGDPHAPNNPPNNNHHYYYP